MAQHDGIEPAHTARTARNGAVLVAALADIRRRIVVQLGRERALAHTRRIGFADADSTVDVTRRQTRIERNARRRRRR